MEFFIDAYKQYANFQGRANRQKYWMFYLFYMLIILILSIVEIMIGLPDVLSGLFALVSLIPGIAITTRRLHDIDKSGWWQLLILIPLIGAIILIIFLIKEGTMGENRFGQDPLNRIHS